MLYGRGKEIRLKIKPATTNTNPKALLQRRSAPWCHSFQAWIQAALLPDRTGAARMTGAVGSQTHPVFPNAGLEQLSSRVVQSVQAAPVSMDPHKVVVAFHSGWLQGVTCAVVVEGRSVRLRLRADGARQRSDLLRGRKILGGRLGSAGFELGGYEVSP